MKPAATALSLAVGVVLADSAIVTLALPDILRQYGTTVGEVSWVLTAFNLVLALAAVPAARLCVRRDPGTLGAAGWSCSRPLRGLRAGPVAGGPAGGASGAGAGRRGGHRRCLELLVAASGSERAGRPLGRRRGGGRGAGAGGRWAADPGHLVAVDLHRPGAAGAGRRAGGRALRGQAGRDHDPSLPADRPHLAANAALALISAALTAALFLLVLLLVEGWRRSPAEAALIVTVIPVAALAAGPLARAARAGTRSEAVAGAVAVAGGLAALALLPGAAAAWTLAPQALVGLGLGLTVDSLTAAALRDRVPRALHGGWTIAARHGGIVAGLLVLTPVFTADLRDARAPAQEAIAAQVLDSRLPATRSCRWPRAWVASWRPRAGACPTWPPRSPAPTCPPRSRARRRAGARSGRPAGARGHRRLPRRVPAGRAAGAAGRRAGAVPAPGG